MGIGAGAAILGAGALGAAGSLATGYLGLQGANSAARTNMSMYNQTRQDLMPYMQAGQGALGQLQNLYGLGTGGMGSALSTLQSTPGYQWAYGQGLQATNQSLAAQGLNLSGGQIAATTQYGQGMANQLYSTYANQLSNLAGLGENAGAKTGEQGTLAAAQAGQAQYSGGLQLGAGVGNAINIGSGLLSSGALGTGGSYGAIGGPVNVTPDVFGGGGQSYYSTGQPVYPSDRRLKKNIRKIGVLDSGLPVYSFEYKGSSLPQIGVMADEVRQVAPEAVLRGRDGYDRVRYDIVSALPAMRKAA